MYRFTELGSMLRDCLVVWSVQLPRIITSQNNTLVVRLCACVEHDTGGNRNTFLLQHWDCFSAWLPTGMGTRGWELGAVCLWPWGGAVSCLGGEAVALMGTCDVLWVMDEENYLGCNASDRLRTEQGCICQGWRRECCISPLKPGSSAAVPWQFDLTIWDVHYFQCSAFLP